MNNGFEQEFLMSAKESAAKDVNNKIKRSNLCKLLGVIAAIMTIVAVVLIVVLIIKNNELSYYNEMFDDEVFTEVDEGIAESDEDIQDIRKVLSCTHGGEVAIGLYSDGSYSVIDLFTSEESESGTFSTDWSTSATLAPEEGGERQVELYEGGLVDNGVRFECKKHEVVQ